MIFWLIPAAGALVALVLAGAGVVSVLRANGQLQKALERARTPRAWMDPQHASAAAARLQADLKGMAAVAARCGAAVQQIRTGLIELRLPEAVTALRLTAFAVRALMHAR